MYAYKLYKLVNPLSQVSEYHIHTNIKPVNLHTTCNWRTFYRPFLLFPLTDVSDLNYVYIMTSFQKQLTIIILDYCNHLGYKDIYNNYSFTIAIATITKIQVHYKKNTDIFIIVKTLCKTTLNVMAIYS